MCTDTIVQKYVCLWLLSNCDFSIRIVMRFPHLYIHVSWVYLLLVALLYITRHNIGSVKRYPMMQKIGMLAIVGNISGYCSLTKMSALRSSWEHTIVLVQNPRMSQCKVAFIPVHVYRWMGTFRCMRWTFLFFLLNIIMVPMKLLKQFLSTLLIIFS